MATPIPLGASAANWASESDAALRAWGTTGADVGLNAGAAALGAEVSTRAGPTAAATGARMAPGRMATGEAMARLLTFAWIPWTARPTVTRWAVTARRSSWVGAAWRSTWAICRVSAETEVTAGRTACVTWRGATFWATAARRGTKVFGAGSSFDPGSSRTIFTGMTVSRTSGFSQAKIARAPTSTT